MENYQQELNPNSRPEPILFLLESLAMGGLERMVLNLTVALANTGRYYPIVHYYQKSNRILTLETDFESAGIKLVPLRKAPGFSFKRCRNLLSIVRVHKVKVIHSHDIGGLIYGSLIKIFARLIGLQLTLVHTQHCRIDLEGNRKNRLYQTIFPPFVDALCTVSQEILKQYAQLHVNTHKLRWISNGVHFPQTPVNSFQAKMKVRQSLATQFIELRLALDCIWILALSRVDSKKGQGKLIEIWNQLDPDTRSKSHLIFLGPEGQPGELARLQEEMKVAKSRKNLHYLGATRDSATWYQACDLFMSGSESEGMPLTLLEASGSGIPCLVSKISGHQISGLQPHFFDLDHSNKAALILTSIINEIEQAKVKNTPETLYKYWKNGEQTRLLYSVENMVKKYELTYHHKKN